MGVSVQLWRAVIAYRVAAFLYAGGLLLHDVRAYAHPGAGLLALVLMAAWTVASVVAYGRDATRGRPFIGADLAVTVALTLASRWIQTEQMLAGSALPLTTVWIAGPVVAAAVLSGPWGGALGAAVTGAG